MLGQVTLWEYGPLTVAVRSDFPDQRCKFADEESMQQELRHNGRLKVWAQEIARATGLSSRDIQHVEHLASEEPRSVHLSDRASAELAIELGIQVQNNIHPAGKVQHRAIVDAAELLNEQLDYAPYGGCDARMLIDQLMREYPLVSKLRYASRDNLRRAIPRLPVCPAVAVRTMQTLAEPNVSLPDVEKIAASDQVLAGKLIAVANSASFAPEGRIATIGRAISHIGIPNTRRLVTAEALRPVFASKRMRALWLHAVQAGKVAEKIAELSQAANPAEAFLAGLVHDVGRLAMALLPDGALQAYDRVLAAGCEQLFAEVVLFGFDHADAGEVILNTWHFPASIIAAVRHHHAPELTDSPLASVLYLAEFWTESDEEAPSSVRLRRAEQTTGITLADLAVANISRRSVVDDLAGVG